MTQYPQINHGNLIPFNIILSEWEDDPQYLEDPDCPYDEHIIEFLELLNPHGLSSNSGSEGSGPREVTVKGNIEALETIEIELFTILSDITEYVNDNKKKLKPNEAMQAYKTRMGIVDKLTIIQTRVTGLKEVHEFQDELLSIMDDILLPEQRTEAMERLKGAIMGTVDMEELSKISLDDIDTDEEEIA